jgi:hypothetical protein
MVALFFMFVVAKFIWQTEKPKVIRSAMTPPSLQRIAVFPQQAVELNLPQRRNGAKNSEVKVLRTLRRCVKSVLNPFAGIIPPFVAFF